MESNMPREVLTSAAILGIAVALGGCGTAGSVPGQGADGGESTAPSNSATQPWRTTDGDVQVACDESPAFPASVAAEGGIDFPADESEAIVTALADLKGKGGIDAPGPLQHATADEVKWAVLWWDRATDEETLGLLVASPQGTGFSLDTDEAVYLDRQDGQWSATGWSGTCGARPVLPAQRAWAQVALPADTTNPAGTDVHLLVSEIECTSARDPEPFLADPVVVETDETVTVYWTTEQMTGGADCPSNPWVPRTIRLHDALGDRTLLDGSTWPPTTVTVADPFG